MNDHNSIIVRKAGLGDLLKLHRLYLTLPEDVKKLFHPFPFSRSKSLLILFVMIISGNIIHQVKRLFPKLGSTIVVAIENKEILGFIFFKITGKEQTKFIANVGILTLPQAQGKGIGSRMYDKLITLAKATGICKFSVTVMERNIASTNQVKKLGYMNKGYTSDEIWNGKSEKNVMWELDLDNVK